MRVDSEKSNTATQRHWLYGANAVFLVAIGLVLLAFLFYFGNLSRGSAWASYDWTSSGVNSLSGSTKRLLSEIADRKQTYRLFSMFPSRSDIEKRENRNAEQDEHRQQVLDMLQEYARRSGRITVEDYGDRATEDVQRQIRDLYKQELKPYEDAIAEFDPLVKKLSEFIAEQAPKIGAAGQKVGTAPRELQLAGTIQSMFQELPDELDTLKRAVKKAREATLPRWGTLKDLVVRGMDESNLMSVLGTLSDKDKVKELPAALAAYFTGANAEYKAMFDELNAYKEKLNKLPVLKVDEVLESLRRNTVAILGGDSAKVVSDFELFTSPPGQGGASPTMVFNGEQAISSALFSMVRPDKVKVVFVGAGGGRGGASYNDIKDLLKAENFDPVDWSPPAPPMPGGPPPEPTLPPAEGKGVVWIVFPPEADPQMAAMGMSMPPNPQPIVDATRKHMAEGGQVLLLAESATSNPMMGGMGGGFPYDDLLHDFGINVQSKYAVVNQQEGDDRDTGQHIVQATPYIQLDQYSDHEITRSMQSLPSVFGPARPPSFATVVGVQSPPPTGVESKVLINSPAGPDYWAESGGFSQDARFSSDSDLASPVPLAAVAVRNKGQKDKEGKSLEQRVAVIGSKQFASDFFLEIAQPVLVGGRPMMLQRFPGNAELMKNTVLWLAGYENMIAVSAKANQAARIGNVGPTQLIWLRTLVAIGVPLAALVLGAMIWMVRHR